MYNGLATDRPNTRSVGFDEILERRPSDVSNLESPSSALANDLYTANRMVTLGEPAFNDQEDWCTDMEQEQEVWPLSPLSGQTDTIGLDLKITDNYKDELTSSFTSLPLWRVEGAKRPDPYSTFESDVYNASRHTDPGDCIGNVVEWGPSVLSRKVPHGMTFEMPAAPFQWIPKTLVKKEVSSNATKPQIPRTRDTGDFLNDLEAGRGVQYNKQQWGSITARLTAEQLRSSTPNSVRDRGPYGFMEGPSAKQPCFTSELEFCRPVTMQTEFLVPLHNTQPQMGATGSKVATAATSGERQVTYSSCCNSGQELRLLDKYHVPVTPITELQLGWKNAEKKDLVVGSSFAKLFEPKRKGRQTGKRISGKVRKLASGGKGPDEPSSFKAPAGRPNSNQKTNTRRNPQQTSRSSQGLATFIRTTQLSQDFDSLRPKKEGPRLALEIRMPKLVNLIMPHDLMSVCKNWTLAEIDNSRRLVNFVVRGKGTTVNLSFYPIGDSEYNRESKNSATISCIYWKELDNYYVTSVDCLVLLELILNQKFAVEEKNRIRRNLEFCKPRTVSKRNESKSFYELIMSYDEPKPRRIIKDVKVFPWEFLEQALRRIVGKYSAEKHSPP